MKTCLSACGVPLALLVAMAGVRAVAAVEVLPPIDQRFARPDVAETPNFQRHMANLFGRLGCNARACHGSFQGRGGFRLSLFGYDFKADHAALLEPARPRVNVAKPDESLIITKPTDADEHEGGQRYTRGSWQYHVIRRWIAGGAKSDGEPERLAALHVTPAEVLLQRAGQQVQLRAVAVWADGTQEDVTPLCRFQINSEPVATIRADGLLTAHEPGDTHAVVCYDNAVVTVPVIRPVTDKVGARYPAVPTPTTIDQLVVEKLRKLGVVPSGLCTDAEFLRRVRLDLTGTLPAPAEVENFLSDHAPNKRARKVDELLKTPAYAAWWTTKLCDWTGNNQAQLNNAGTIRGQASQEWYDWLYKRVAANTPYDQIAGGMITAVSRRPGQSYLAYCEEMSALHRKDTGRSFADRPSMPHYWSRQDFRDPDARAVAFAYSFMGVRLQCAQCHKHPFDQWSKDDFQQFKNFFTGVSAARVAPDPETQKQYQEVLRRAGLADQRGNDLQRAAAALLDKGHVVPFLEVCVVKPAAGRANPKNPRVPVAHPTARLLGGEVVDLTKTADPREKVMQWLRAPENRYFARAFVNRVWAAYFPVGIVNPPDDNSLGNPPSNQPLLDYLARGFIDSGFDMQWVHRQITTSQTYQRSSQPNETNRQDQTNFSHAIPRRLPAEVVYDAIQQATGSDQHIAQLHAGNAGRAIAIASPGGRANRGGDSAYALTVFGRSTRISNCDCDRASEASLLQTVYLQNDRDLLQALTVRPGAWLEQVARQWGPAPAAANGQAKRQQPENQKQELAALEQKLKRAQASANRQAVDRLQQRLAALRKTVPTEAPAPKPAVPPPAAFEPLVRQAYLRTLSRYPSDAERQRCVQYLSASPDKVTGARDLLWALLNTKEFIVNH